MDPFSHLTNVEALLCILKSKDTAVKQTNSLASIYIPLKVITHSFHHHKHIACNKSINSQGILSIIPLY